MLYNHIAEIQALILDTLLQVNITKPYKKGHPP